MLAQSAMAMSSRFSLLIAHNLFRKTDPRFPSSSRIKKSRHALAKARRSKLRGGATASQEAAALGARLRELRWKNSAWLATAETMAGWNGLEIKNAGSGRSPVRN